MIKFYNYSIFVLKISLGFVFSIFFFLISFFKNMRIYKVHHFLGASQYLEIYLHEKDMGFHKKYCDIFSIDNFILFTFFANKKKYNLTFLSLIFSEIYNKDFKFKIYKIPLYFVYNLIFDFMSYFNFSKYLIPINTHSYLYQNNLKQINFNKNILSINKTNEIIFESFFKKFLLENNIQNYKGLITYANRDQAYKKFLDNKKNWTYHNFRNFSPDVFISTIENFCNKNYLNCRVGNVSEQKLIVNNSLFIDYSKSKSVSEQLDIYLIFKSKFFVGSGSGLDKIASFFKIPILYVNPINLSYLPHYVQKCIIVPNIFYDLKTNKKINFSNQVNRNFKKDILTNRNLSKYATFEEFNRNEIKIIYNTSEDIENAANEINLLSENKLILSKKEIEIQNKFWEIIKINKISKNFIISPSFLSKNLDLIR
jgi:putative glycosyltransferase (TIGR04372 family)